MPPRTRPLDFDRLSIDESLARARAFAARAARRRTVRDFSPDPVPRVLIETCLAAAGTAPSGANQQPWHFVAVGTGDSVLRRTLREAAEAEEASGDGAESVADPEASLDAAESPEGGLSLPAAEPVEDGGIPASAVPAEPGAEGSGGTARKRRRRRGGRRRRRGGSGPAGQSASADAGGDEAEGSGPSGDADPSSEGE